MGMFLFSPLPSMVDIVILNDYSTSTEETPDENHAYQRIQGARITRLG